VTPKRTLVVAAHPDDEVLGCGGTISKLLSGGGQVKVHFMTDGTGAREASGGVEKDDRHKASLKALEILGCRESPSFSDFPDNGMDQVALLDIVRTVEELVLSFKPDQVLTHHGGDLNVDHCLTQKAVLTACRPQPSSSVGRILFFEVPSSTGWGDANQEFFNPTWYEDISDHLLTKVRALEAYEEELRVWPHARSLGAVKALAEWRGANVGLGAAEAFVLGRNLG
jgi:N-acetylglucosamine malate deacetylase 1